MKSLFDLLENYKITSADKKSERGEVLRELSKLTGFSIPRLCGMFPSATLKDWYFLKSDCSQARCDAKVAILHNKNLWNGLKSKKQYA